jgi:hypothetical protein
MKKRYITINIENNVGWLEISKEKYQKIKDFIKNNISFNIDDNGHMYSISKDSFGGTYGLNLVKVDDIFSLEKNSGNTKFLKRIVDKIIDIENNLVVDNTPTI